MKISRRRCRAAEPCVIVTARNAHLTATASVAMTTAETNGIISDATTTDVLQSRVYRSQM